MTRLRDWILGFLPSPNTADRREQARAAGGALVGLLLTAALSHLALGGAGMLIAPMGASAVLLFCLPASPLAQPWSVVGGNTLSAIIGVLCAHLVPDPMLAAPLAGCLAIVAMFQLRCLHPPGGAVALTAVLGGPAIHAAGLTFALLPVGLNCLLMTLAALLYNNLSGRAYPHSQRSSLRAVHATADPAPTERVGFSSGDLDAALENYGQVLDISRDDLEAILFDTEMHAYARRAGVTRCADIMSRDTVTVGPHDTLAQAWRLLRLHRLHALPVVDARQHLVGILAQGDLLRHAGLDDVSSLAGRLRRWFGTPGQVHVHSAMTRRVTSAPARMPIAALVPLMANGGLHHIPVLDDSGRLAGIVTQSDVLAALAASRLAA